MEAGGTHIESGRVISEAFENYRNYAGPLLAGALLMVGIAGVISGVLEASDSLLLALLGLIVYIAAGVLYTGYVVKLVQDVRDGRRDHSIEELFESAAPYIGTLILNGILAAIGIGLQSCWMTLSPGPWISPCHGARWPATTRRSSTHPSSSSHSRTSPACRCHLASQWE